MENEIEIHRWIKGLLSRWGGMSIEAILNSLAQDGYPHSSHEQLSTDLFSSLKELVKSGDLKLVDPRSGKVDEAMTDDILSILDVELGDWSTRWNASENKRTVVIEINKIW